MVLRMNEPHQEIIFTAGYFYTGFQACQSSCLVPGQKEQEVYTMKKQIVTALNVAFVISGIAILLFLLKAPEETTAQLPRDENHLRFFSIESKKEAEKFCAECHSPGQEAPLPADHPPQYRCLFCHKRDT